MASFSLKRGGYLALPNIAQKITISDANMTALLQDRRDAYGQVPDGAGGMRDMTDDEVTVRLFNETLLSIVGQASANIREKAARAAALAQQPIAGVLASDAAP